MSAALMLALGCGSDEPAGRLGPGPCPDRMVRLVELDACIDRHEAAIEDGAAVPADGRMPTTGISWFEARAACREAGYRLCTLEEWFFACSGVRGPGGEDGTEIPEGGRAFAYGDAFEARRCNTNAEDEEQEDQHLAPGGSHPRCVTPEGVYDLSGNAAEWLETAAGPLRHTAGGSFGDYERYVHCANDRPSIHRPETSSSGFGFRCCQDVSP